MAGKGKTIEIHAAQPRLRKFLAKLDTLDDLLEQSTRVISPAVCGSMILSETYQKCQIYTQKIFETMNS